MIGSGAAGSLPVLEDALAEEAERRGVQLLVLPTTEAIEEASSAAPDATNAILHVTC